MPSQPPRALRPIYILNGKSAVLDRARAAILQISNEFGVEAKMIVAPPGEDFTPLARRAADERGEPVVAGGGDGTVSAVAGAVAGTGTALGVLPMGTLNHFAKDAGVPLDLEAAVRNVFEGGCAEVDVGEVNGRVFVNNSGLGFYPNFVREREQEERLGWPKPMAFVLALGLVPRRFLRLRIRANMDRGEALETVTPFLFVGSNRYVTSGLKIGTRPRLDSGRLWVCTGEHVRRRDLLRAAFRTLVGRETDQDLDAFEAEDLWVEPETPKVSVSRDGEVGMLDGPIHYRIRPRALRVVLPSAK